MLVLAAVTLIVTFASVQGRTTSTTSGMDLDAELLLAQARQAVKFDVLQPGWLPDGFRLTNVMWVEPSEETGATRSSIDSWFEDAQGRRIHLWQTDIEPEELGEKDPVAKGSPSDINGEVWSQIDDHASIGGMLTILSRRMPDGTTVSMDGPIDETSLAKVAGSLGP